MICNQFGISCVGYSALLAKNSGIVNNCTSPNILSRLFIHVAIAMDRLEKPMPKVKTIAATAAKYNGLKLMLTPITTAMTKIIAACNSPLIPPVNDFPRAIAVLGTGEQRSLSSCPRSLSQISDIPVKIEMNKTETDTILSTKSTFLGYHRRIVR